MKEHLFKYITIILSAIIALLTLEIGCRIWHGIPIFSDENFIIETLSIIKKSSNYLVYDPDTGWTVNPNTKFETSTTGPYGIRYHTQEATSIPQNAILVVGDSFAAGAEVPPNQSWPAYLEQLLNEPVINAAQGGYGMDQIVLRAEKLVPIYRPHTLIIGLLTECVLRNTYDIFGGGCKPYFVIQNNKLVLKNHPVPRLEIWNQQIGFVRSILGHSYLLHWLFKRSGHLECWINQKHQMHQVHKNEMGDKISKLLLDRLIKLKNQYNMRLIVVLQYGAGQLLSENPPWYGTPTIKAAEEKGLESFDTYLSLKKKPNQTIESFRKLWVMHEYNAVYGHMSAEGNQLVARLIYEKFFENEN